MTKIIIIHGNGGATGQSSWLPAVASELEKLGYDVLHPTFPDNVKARASYWIPYLQELGADDDTVLIGHSSGALATMYFAQTRRLLGSVLVGAAHTDLGEASERISGYFDTPWDWDAIRRNQNWILQYGSPTDPYIPITEQRFVQKKLGTTYFELPKRGHFEDHNFPELAPAVHKKLKNMAASRRNI